MTRRDRQQRVTRWFLLVWAAWGVTLGAIRAVHPGLEIGFAGNDAHILVASEWFAAHGHFGTLLIPPRQTAPRPDGSWQLYNTYPAGVFWLHELRRAAGLSQLWEHRVAATAWNHVAVLLLFFLVRRVSRDAMIAALAASLYMFSAPYAATAGGLWEHAPMLTLVATIGAWVAFERGRRRGGAARWTWLAGAAALCAADSLLSVQNAPMLGVIIGASALRSALRAWRRGRAWMPVLWACAIVLIMPVVVLGARVAAQARLAGGFGPAIRLLADRAQMRMGGGVGAEHDPAGPAWRVVGTRLGLPLMHLTHPRAPQGMFPALSPLAMVGAVLAIWMVWRVRGSSALRAHRRAAGFGALLLAASMTWPVLFPEHAAGHHFVVLMSMPGAAILLGALVVSCWTARSVRRARGERAWWAFPGALLATGLMVAPILLTLKRSELLNAAVPLDPRTAGMVRHRAQVEEARGAAATFVAGARLMETVHSPLFGVELRLPYHELGPSRPRPDEHGDLLLAVPVSDDPGRRTAAQLAGRFGIPRFLASPGDMIFYGYRTGIESDGADASVDLLVAPGVRWREAAFAPTLERRAFVAAVLLEGDGMSEFVRANPVVRVAITRGGRSGEPFVAETHLDRSLARASKTLMAWVEVPLEGAEGWETAEVSIGAVNSRSASTTLRRPR